MWFGLVWVGAGVPAGQGRVVCSKCGQEGAKLTADRGKMKYEGRLFHDLLRSAARDMIRVRVAPPIAAKVCSTARPRVTNNVNAWQVKS